jgi:ABC-2 type transport system permease protein
MKTVYTLQQGLAVARLTALEAIRQPLALLLFATVLSLIALLPLILSHTLGESERFVRDGALALMWLSGLLLSAHLASASLAEEARRGTIATVLSKPVSRPVFFLAKYAGIAVVMLLFCAGLLMAVLLSARTASFPYVIDWHSALPLLLALAVSFFLGGLINFFLRRPFVSNTFVLLFLLLLAAFLYAGWVDTQGAPVPFGAHYDWRILPAGMLVTLATLLLAGLSVALATRLRATATLAVCGALFLFGLLSDYLFGQAAGNRFGALLLHRLLPNWQHYWVVDALTGGGHIPLSYVGMVAVYTGLYLAGLLVLGLIAFRYMEVRTN